MKVYIAANGAWRPTCHAVIRDNATAAQVLDTLRKHGWAVVQHASGYHLVEAISDAILGQRPWDQVGMVIVDDASPGCLGATIARGLREVGATCPLVVIASGRDPDAIAVEDPDRAIYVLDPIVAPAGIARIARHVKTSESSSKLGTTSGPPDSARA
jgi:DNA-binding response OmpR family regulator